MPSLIDGAHTIIYAKDANRARAFLRDVLGFSAVDAGEGWLIFAAPPSELAVHPASDDGVAAARHELLLMCHDINDCVRRLRAKGVKFVAPVSDQGWGLITRFRIPGAGEVGLYQPKHPSPLREFARPHASRPAVGPSPVRRRRRAARP
jgi:catechol 2,3-dioxygenase-like lactoylglutathione lyase family enzyme